MVESYEMPPLVPDHETVVADEQYFVDACNAVFAEQAQRFEWVFGKSLLTRSHRWGLIWRTDFVVANRPSSYLVNRAMCWGGAGGVEGTAVAFGQQIGPLEQSSA
jgi:hypothetical protein